MGKRITLIFSLLAVCAIAVAQSFPFPTENLQLWLRADSVELTDGKVSRWFDQSPNKYEIVQPNAAARPTVTENALNGHPALTFNGTSNYLIGGDILDLGTDSWTWFVVINNYAKNSYVDGKSRAGGYPSKYAQSTSFFIYTDANNQEKRNTFTLSNSSCILCWVNDKSALKNIFYANGNNVSEVAIANTDMQSSFEFRVGTIENSGYYKGQIAEIIAGRCYIKHFADKKYCFLKEN